MESHSLEFEFHGTSLPVQVIKMSGSYFVYLGKSNFSFENLIVGFQHKDIHGGMNPCISTIFDDLTSEIGKNIVDRLGKLL